jgi:RNA polymerase sigma-70 factor, ECF subfamily
MSYRTACLVDSTGTYRTEVAFIPWNKIVSEPVREIGYDERRLVMNDEKLRARFESQIMPLLNEAYNLARWLMKNEHDAEDAVQEAYLRAYRFFEGFHGDSGKVWLLKIVRNVCLNKFASRAAQGHSVQIDDASVVIEDLAPLPPAVLAQKNTVELVRTAVESLPADFRTVIVMREMEGLSYKEIAEATNVPIGTVMSRLARARQHLGAILTERRKLGQL